jgi:outer membrane protein assembly factor BamB
MNPSCPLPAGRTAWRFALLLVALSFVSNVPALDWPAYRNDAQRSARTEEAPGKKLNLQWVYEPAHKPDPAWPMPGEESPRMHTDRAFHVTVAGQRAFFGSSADGKVYCLNTRTGKVQWSFFTDGPVRFAPQVADGRLYFGSDDGHAYCVDVTKGKLLWKYRPGPSGERIIGKGRVISLWPLRSGVLVDKGVAYFSAGVFPYEGLHICAVDAKTGKEIWTNDTAGDLAWGQTYGGMAPQGYMLTSEEMLYVPSGRGMPAAFDRKDGQFRKFLSGGGKVGGSWALIDQGQLIAGSDNKGTPIKVAFEANGTGKVGDMFANFPGVDMVMTPETAFTMTQDGIVAIRRKAYATAAREIPKMAKQRTALGKEIGVIRGSYKTLAATKAKLSKPKSETEKKELAAATLKLKKLQAKLTTTTKALSALATREKELTGARLAWNYSNPDLNCLVKAGDTIYAGGKNVALSIDLSTGEQAWTDTVDGLVIGMSVADKRLFISSDSGKIYCYAAKPVKQAARIKRSMNPAPFANSPEADRYRKAAKNILANSVQRGFALVLGAGEGQLAWELAKQSELTVVVVEHDQQRRERVRGRLDAAGMTRRVAVVDWNYADLPDYFANLIVSDEVMQTGKLSAPASEIMRTLRPAGGTLLLATTKSFNANAYLAGTDTPRALHTANNSLWKIVRPKLEGAGSWTGLYGNVANTGSSPDEHADGPFGVLWYGEPGSRNMPDRHARSVSPLAVNGRMFIQGEEIVMAYDSYNGTFLWERKITGAIRVRVDVDGSNLSATDDAIFIAANDTVHQLDAQTGRTVREFPVPPAKDGKARRWAYIAAHEGILYGSASAPLKNQYGFVWNGMIANGKWKPTAQISEAIRAIKMRDKSSLPDYLKKHFSVPDERALNMFKRDGLNWKYSNPYPGWLPDHTVTSVSDTILTSEAMFAYDINNGRLLWEHQGKDIPNISISLGEGKVFFVQDDLTNDEKKKAAAERKSLIENGVYDPHDEEKLKEKLKDYRRVVALDGTTGQTLWSKPVDLSGCGAAKLGTAFADGRLLFFGHYSNHDQSQFAKGGLEWRRITVMDTEGGNFHWSRPLNSRRRPLVMRDTIFIEPRACDLSTGNIKQRPHPVTGKPVPWEFLRPGHSCGIVTASPNSIFYRSFSAAIVNVERDSGLTLFGGTRPGCWTSIIPANGLISMQESSAGCTCSYGLRTTVVLKTKKQKGPGEWSVFITSGAMTPVSHLALNLGAPGDMRDRKGTLWFSYPRPDTASGQGSFRNYGVKFKLGENSDSKVIQRDFRGANLAGTDRPWLYTSGIEGLKSCTIPLMDGKESGVFRVRLGFMVPPSHAGKNLRFDVKLMGKTVLKNFNPISKTGAINRVTEHEFSGLKVAKDLTIELVPSDTTGATTLIQTIEIMREDKPPKQWKSAWLN